MIHSTKKSLRNSRKSSGLGERCSPTVTSREELKRTEIVKMKVNGELKELSNLLKEFNKKGCFEASWIIDSSGRVMADTIQNEVIKEELAAMSTIVFMQSERIRDYLSIQTSDLCIKCENLHFYFRRISVAHMTYMLVGVFQQNGIKELQNHAHGVSFGQSVQEKTLDWVVKRFEIIFDSRK